MKDQKSEKPEKPMEKQTTQPAEIVGLGRDIRAKIGQHLRTMYDEVVKEAVPEHLADLLNQLDKPDDKEPQE